MKIFTFSDLKNVLVSLLFILIALNSTQNNAMAVPSTIFPIGDIENLGGTVIPFHIKNVDHRTVTITFIEKHCWEGSIINGQVTVLAPNEQLDIRVLRRQGHGCDGDNGSFRLVFSPKIGDYESVEFNFTNDGSLWIPGNIPNVYPGKLEPRATDGSYTFKTFATEKLKAGKVSGSWELVCQGNCNKEVWSEVTNESSKEKILTAETKKAISVSLESGMDFKFGSASVNVTASLEEMNSQTISETVMNSTTKGEKNTFYYTPEQMRDLKIFAVWQWVGRTTMSDNSVILIKTDKFTCTSDAFSPKYVPGSPVDIGSCTGGN